MVPRICRLIGCRHSKPYGGPCRHCGSDFYDWTWVERGQVEFIPDAFRSALYWVTHRCDPCKRRMWFTSRPSCSAKCVGDSLPF